MIRGPYTLLILRQDSRGTRTAPISDPLLVSVQGGGEVPQYRRTSGPLHWLPRSLVVIALLPSIPQVFRQVSPSQ